MATVLDQPVAEFPLMRPVAWGAAGPAERGPGGASSQSLAYRFDFETELASLPSGGGVIRTVAVTERVDGETENFLVITEGGSA